MERTVEARLAAALALAATLLPPRGAMAAGGSLYSISKALPRCLRARQRGENEC